MTSRSLEKAVDNSDGNVEKVVTTGNLEHVDELNEQTHSAEGAGIAVGSPSSVVEGLEAASDEEVVCTVESPAALEQKQSFASGLKTSLMGGFLSP